MVLNSVIVRTANDDFGALRIANAMQGIEGVDVVSIVRRPVRQLTPSMPAEQWHVFAKYDAGAVTPDKIDAAIHSAR